MVLNRNTTIYTLIKKIEPKEYERIYIKYIKIYKIHISSNFLFSICLLIMLDTILLGPSLHYNTSLHFTQLHFTTLIDTSLPLIYTSLPSHLAQPSYISYRSISPHITKLILLCQNGLFAIYR